MVTFDYILKKSMLCEKKLKVKFNDHQLLIQNLFRLQTKIGEIYGKALEKVREKPMSIVISAYWKNLYSLFAALELNNKGLYGPSRFLIRHSFEFLILAKYCAIKKDTNLIRKWEIDGDYIALGDLVSKKITKPNVKEFDKTWSDLCKFSHASKYSMQLCFDEDNKFDQEIEATCVLIQIMLECNYHLLNSYFVNGEMRFLIQHYLPEEDTEIKQAKKEIKDLIKIGAIKLSHYSKTLIKKYKLKWTIN